MSYFKSAEDAKNKAHYAPSSLCVCCGGELTGPTIAYDTYIGKNTCQTSLTHRDCAFAMAQRIICDSWPNRRDGGWMQTNAN